MKKKINFRKRITMQVQENGVSIWLDKKWIIDASTILIDGTFSISPEKIKKLHSNRGVNKDFIVKLTSKKW